MHKFSVDNQIVRSIIEKQFWRLEKLEGHLGVPVRPRSEMFRGFLISIDLHVNIGEIDIIHPTGIRSSSHLKIKGVLSLSLR